MEPKQLQDTCEEVSPSQLSGDARPPEPAANGRSADAQTDVWMPFYIGDYLRDTMHLSTEEHGAYLLLLLAQWTGGPLPDNDRLLRRITRCDEANWVTVKATLREFFVIADGHWTQLRLERERIHAQNRKRRASAGAKATNESRWGSGVAKTSLNCRSIVAKSVAKTSLNCRTSPSPSPSPSLNTRTNTFAQNDGEAVVSEPLPPPALVSEKHAENISQAQIIEIYQHYPRRVGAIAAYKAIEKAYRMLRKGGTGRAPLDHAAAIALLLSRTKQFAESADGKWAGGEDYRPYPATWFNQGRFLDEAAQKPKRVYVNA
jgi:uncharacterized protein YdaU (DUF1376 family)